jgi:hypothetical protein
MYKQKRGPDLERRSNCQEGKYPIGGESLPYVISAWAACFSPPLVCYYSSILDIIYSWPIDSYQWSINSFYVYSIP